MNRLPRLPDILKDFHSNFSWVFHVRSWLMGFSKWYSDGKRNSFKQSPICFSSGPPRTKRFDGSSLKLKSESYVGNPETGLTELLPSIQSLKPKPMTRSNKSRPTLAVMKNVSPRTSLPTWWSAPFYQRRELDRKPNDHAKRGGCKQFIVFFSIS